MIEVLVQNETQFPVDEIALQRVVSRVFLSRDVTIAQVGVSVVGIEKMTQLNEQYKHHEGATDVLSFVLHDPEQPTPGFLETPETETEYGDIFLCYEVIAEEAEEQGIEVQEQLEFLTEHACLHLLGVHHE